MAQRVLDPTGVTVELTEERWAHICEDHPEMRPHRTDIKLAIERPNVIYRMGMDRRYYRRTMTAWGERYLLVIVPEGTHGAFVVTAYITSSIRAREGAELIWLSR